jgi:serine/threonine-protein kinase
MALAAGTRFGDYSIVSSLGAGGMGEVFRARDTRLNRDVAIKVLPEIFAADVERRSRFEREAQTLAALNHPNIAHIYGVLEQPAALVMELAEGEDLAERIARIGRLPVDEALTIARQIAAALDAAHDRGIVHRDLKPSNVRIGPGNTVKVVDFGLALDVARASMSPDTADSPTFTSPALLTRAGMILGTAAYMAPEQARGQMVDRRADIWAFGCVLYEMLTGRRAFEGESIADVLHAILGAEPDWRALPDATPGRVREVLAWCLRRDPAERLKDAGDLRLLLSAIHEPGMAPAPPARRSRVPAIVSVIGWAAAAALAGVLLWTRAQPPSPAAPRVMYVDVPLTPAIEAANRELASNFALTPDGGHLVYAARQESSTALFLHDFATGESQPLPDTADASAPFMSPDGTSVGFVTGDRIRAISLSGRLGHDLVDASSAAGSARLSADWEPAGVVFTGLRGLQRVASTGGTPSQAAELLANEAAFLTPRVLPDGRHLLVAVRKKTATKTDDPSEIAVIDTATNAHHVIVEQGGSPALLRAADGNAFLVYARAGRLWAARFDLSRLALDGAAQPVIDNVEMRPNGDGAQFAVSATGTLAYIEASPTELVWVDRNGNTTPASAVTRRYAMPRVRPNGRTIAVEVQAVPHQLWLLEPERDLISPLTQWKEGSHDFAWSPDGRSLAFTASVGDAASVMWMPLDGSRDPVALIESDSTGEPWVNAWSRDGRHLAIFRSGRTRVLQVVPIEPGAPPRVAGAPVTIAAGDAILSADLSPDGGWVAWCGSASGRADSTVYIARTSGGRQYEIDAGSEPRWAPAGRVLYYRKGREMMAVDVSGGADAGIGRPRKLFGGDFLHWGTGDYDVTGDGRFLMVRTAASAVGRVLKVRLHWDDELKKLF